MTKFLLMLHLVFAVFAVGPLVHAATTAGRGIRKGDAAACASSVRLLRVYSIASALVVIVGIGLMYRQPNPVGYVKFSSPTGITMHRSPSTSPDYLTNVPQHLGEFGQTWIWLSLVLWAVALLLIFLVAIPGLTAARTQAANGESATALTGRVAAAGGLVGVAFVAIVVLMVYRPGQ